MNDFFSYAEHFPPPVISWSEMYDEIGLEFVSNSDELERLLDGITIKLDERLSNGEFVCNAHSPRVLVSGCPVGGDAAKVFRVIEEAGGAVVAMEACSGMKGYSIYIDEDSGDPISALAKAYLKIPCSCMTPNQRRFDTFDELVERFRPDAVVDVILQACYSYNIESHRIEQHVRDKYHLPFLKIETDFTESDRAMIKTRVEAIFESI
jgi:benzoyl-CoA reductase/2-hydroxyglutaryl-CoA dehydratase subunit BcrC/BadD/HgdB